MKKVERLVFETYLAVIKNSVGSNMFRNFYAKVDGEPTDIMKDGKLSCAFFASSILTLFKFIRTPHGTVAATVKDLNLSGWSSIKDPVMGSVIIWEEADFGSGSAHKHIGFYIGKDRVISNSSKLGYPVEHHYTFDGSRKIESILWNPEISRIS